jgi:ABC-type nitrate/sulfonate/bicarbonate transport system ATPase subunit
MKNHTFLIKSTKNSSFGTAFCIKQDTKGSYFVTCTHVVEDCRIDSLTIEQHQLLGASGSGKSSLLFAGILDHKIDHLEI